MISRRVTVTDVYCLPIIEMCEVHQSWYYRKKDSKEHQVARLSTTFDISTSEKPIPCFAMTTLIFLYGIL